MTGKESADEGAVGASLLLWEPCHLVTWETRKPNTVAKVDSLEMTEKWHARRRDVGAEEGLSGVCC